MPWRLAALGRRWLAPDRRDAAYCTLRSCELAELEFDDPDHPGIPLDTPERRELLDLASRIPPSEFDSQFTFPPVSRAQGKAYFEFARADLEATGSTSVAPLIGPLFTMGECATTRTILEQLVADDRQRGIAPSIAFNLALLSRWQNILGDFDAADASLAEGMSLIPRIAETSNATFQVYGAAALNARVRGVRLSVETIDAFNQWDGSPNTRWAWTIVVAARSYALSLAGRVDEAMDVFHEALPIVERAGGWAPNYLLLIDELVKTLWYAQRTDDLELLERNLRAKVLEPDHRYPETDGRWAMALLCALDGRVDEATDWFAEARRVLAEQETWPLLVDVDLDEARMHLRLGARGDAARVADLIAEARAHCTHPAMAPWLEHRRADRAISISDDGFERRRRCLERSDTQGSLTRANVVILTTAVDLMGRLSNPPDPLETLTGQGIAGSGDVRGKRSKTAKARPSASGSGRPENTGRLSNPGDETVQRRLTDADVDELVTGYQAGRSLPDLAEDFGVHRRTVAAHLEQRGVQRRVNRRKMTEDDIREAACRYLAGDSLATVGDALGVHAATVRRELVRAGVDIRLASVRLRRRFGLDGAIK